ncbi:alpha/beta fold hydrolase [Wenzhouxiangella sp. XN79A]|uniref:homoserine O-acetyltransferase family protein n=1 Tax=Wenzhouxiangella sp. XN79A TaxID=2724193 RepID=UPI00144A63B6|nr:alpha/beta fold hydrolase [Wenzhouxiangella sp. XN79A]NKI33927.1 alpha/beta fold hydrolase [Wenzhouxiangella sp. XN79A]
MTGRDGWINVASPPTWRNGARSEGVAIRYRSWGRLAPARDNAVLVCPALTGDRRVDRWWDGLLGPGRALDPTRSFIVSMDVVGGSGGTRSRPALDAVDVRDMVQAQRLLIDALGIDRLERVIGGSLGGMQALEWAVGHPDRVASAVVIAAPARQTAWAAGLNHVQRRAIERHGDLELARMVAMLSYRHWSDLDGRLRPLTLERGAVGGWLNHHGDALRARFDAAAYLRLMRAMDHHDVGRDRNGTAAALAGCRVPTLVVGITSDLLYPPDELHALADGLGRAQLGWLTAAQGHDAFLIEQRALDRLIREFDPCTVRPETEEISA